MSRRSTPRAQQSAACFATHMVEARLCRWLLRARDLSGSDYLPFTQEYLAEMLGVRRTSVTEVAHTLQEAGLIKYARGKIQTWTRPHCEKAPVNVTVRSRAFTRTAWNSFK